MTQWLGKYRKPFTGHTHSDHVDHVEAALQQAAAALRQAAGTRAFGAKAKAVQRLAVRLHAVRLREVRALLATEAPVPLAKKQPRINFDSLRAKGLAILAKGVTGILAEFDVPDILKQT
jgi:hypothetical protein